MKMKAFTKLLVVLTLFSIQCVKAQSKKSLQMKTINIGGIVVDAESLSPMQGAKIYNKSNSKLLGTTNSKGYFQGSINHQDNTEIYFSLIIVGNEGYEVLIQKEHWGDLYGDLQAMYYFGLKKENNPSSSFSKVSLIENDISYEYIHNQTDEINKEVNLNKAITKSANNNENVFFEVQGKYFIVSNTGWIKIKSKEDLISVNGVKTVPASELNKLIKRKSITYMSPVDSENASYEIRCDKL